MVNEDFEKGRQFEAIKRDLRDLVGKMVTTPEGEKIRDNEYFLLRAHQDKFETIRKEYYPKPDSLLQAMIDSVGHYRGEIEKRLGPEEIARLDAEYANKWAQK